MSSSNGAPDGCPSGSQARTASQVRAAVLCFPGTNCEMDVCWALSIAGAEAELLFHDSAAPDCYDLYVIPGGFAHGDYLRPGAIARFSPVMQTVREAARAGKPVVGICNGFQILCEAGLLPGALQKNVGLSFLCRPVDLLVVDNSSPLTFSMEPGRVLHGIPINHFEGNFAALPRTLEALERNGQVVFRYCGPTGQLAAEYNPNGSANAIAGICNETRNIAAMMPHPERAAEAVLGSDEGLEIIRSMVAFAARSKRERSEPDPTNDRVDNVSEGRRASS